MDILTILGAIFLEPAQWAFPRILVSIIILIIGWIIGTIVGRVTKEIIMRLKVDQYISKGKKPMVRLSDMFSIIFSWAIYLVAITAAFSKDIWGIATLENIMTGVISFISGAIIAIIVVVVGYAIAEYIRRQVEASKMAFSELMGRVLFFLIIYIAIAIALPKVGIDASLVNNILLIIVASAGIGFAIALGLGLKETIAEMAKEYRKKLKQK